MIETAIIGGSGLNTFDGARRITEMQLDTPYGPASAALQIFALGATHFGFLARHGQAHNIPPHRVNYRANLWALHAQGVRNVVAVNAVGGITEPTGAVIIPDQIIDYTYGREHTYYDGGDAGLEHVDFSLPYDAVLRDRLRRAADVADVPVIGRSVYGATQGPRLESSAEIDRLQRDGCDVVGMTGMPEAGLARELGLAYASLCLVVNPAAGRSNEPITLEKMAVVMASGMLEIQKVLRALLAG